MPIPTQVKCINMWLPYSRQHLFMPTHAQINACHVYYHSKHACAHHAQNNTCTCQHSLNSTHAICTIILNMLVPNMLTPTHHRHCMQTPVKFHFIQMRLTKCSSNMLVPAYDIMQYHCRLNSSTQLCYDNGS